MAQDFLQSAQKYFREFEPRHSLKTEVWETIRFILIALAIVVPIRLFIAQPFIVSGSSMDPTFTSGQYLIIDELSYHISDPIRGDVAVFKNPRDTKQYFIKRVIGLPGDTVSIDEQGKVSIKLGSSDVTVLTLKEPYIALPKGGTMSMTLGPDEYFMMGDNRAGSFDSRAWGPLKRDLFVGKAFVRLFPFNTIDMFPGEYRQYN